MEIMDKMHALSHLSQQFSPSISPKVTIPFPFFLSSSLNTQGTNKSCSDFGSDIRECLESDTTFVDAPNKAEKFAQRE